MAENTKIGLGDTAGAGWMDVAGSGDNRSAVWGGYGKSGMPAGTHIAATAGNFDLTQNASDILEAQKGALDWFHLVYDRYVLADGAVKTGALQSKSEIGRLYMQQSDMNLNKLYAAGQSIAGAQGTMQQAYDGQQQATRQLAGYWQGPSGTAAQDSLTEFGTWSASALSELNSLPAIITAAVDGIKICLQQKANAFGTLNGVTRINGVDMSNGTFLGAANSGGNDGAEDTDDVSMIINYAAARGIGDTVRMRIQILADQGVLGARERLPHYLPHKGNVYRGDDGLGKTLFDQVAQGLCIEWTQHFRESAEGYFSAYGTLCSDTDTAVKAYLATLSDKLASVGEIDKAPVPNDENPGYVPASPGGTSPAGTTPADTTAASVNPVAAAPADNNPVTNNPNTGNPVTTNPSTTNVSTLLSGVSSLLSKGAETVQAASTALQQNLTQLTTNAGTGTGIGTTSNPVTFTVGGNTLSLAQTTNGALTATVTGTDGKAQKYTLGIQNGLPYLTHSDETTDAPAETVAAATDSHNTTAAGVSTSSDSSTSAASTVASSSSGMAMGGMPAMGGMGAAGGGGAAESEHRASSIMPPKPLWDTAADSGGTTPAPNTEEVATEMAFSITSENSTPPAPSTNGVKIEIDLGGR
ncbi:hypothetical protein JK358_00480 [Nocardia sp. 2]|uniref:Uncharacterized protein n=1 Tax=Nocardia acididurans TaxID=2802282 RepID=A0ABS1LZB1_9NOCA|nr:hypothetical protein [Nocardia acididurans]MBL1072864.1 hypothetical protein [Nocardia acididurans]